MKVKILIPVYNDWQSLSMLIDKINNLLREINARNRNNTKMFVKTIEKTTKLNLNLLINIKFHN